jgi:hypothetical protein
MKSACDNGSAKLRREGNGMARDTLQLQRAARRAELLLLAKPVFESVLARREQGRADAPPELIEVLAQELCSAREPDGSWQLSACRTAEQLLLLRELDPDGELLADLAAPSLSWLQRRLSVSRRDGAMDLSASVTLCTPLMHELGACVHAAPELLLVVPARIDLSALRLSNGTSFMSDIDARVAVCALTVAALLAWGIPSTAMQPHLRALERVALIEDEQRISLLSTNGNACLALALLAAEPAFRSEPGKALASVSRVLARAQRADGTWPNADFFFVLSAVQRAAGRTQLEAVLDRTLRRSAQQLALLQQPDGGWSRDRGAWSLLVGWRVLRAAAAAEVQAHAVADATLAVHS